MRSHGKGHEYSLLPWTDCLSHSVLKGVAIGQSSTCWICLLGLAQEVKVVGKGEDGKGYHGLGHGVPPLAQWEELALL